MLALPCCRQQYLRQLSPNFYLIRLQAYKLHFAGFFQDQRIGGSCWLYSHLFRFAGLFLAIFWPVGAARPPPRTRNCSCEYERAA